MTDTCEKCGAVVSVSDWPFCPHGTRGAYSNIPDDVPGGFVAENGFTEPRRFYSHSEHRRALAERGLEIRAKHAGDRDKHLTNWAAAIDPVTMANAAELLTRGTRTREEPQEERIPITVTTLDEKFTYRMEP